MKNNIIISNKAAEKILEIAKESPDKVFLRVVVSSGGCFGFSYQFNFDNQKKEEDCCFEYKGAKVIVDDVSLKLIKGSTIDYHHELMGAFFTIKNPKSKSSCGCGNSFSLEG